MRRKKTRGYLKRVRITPHDLGERRTEAVGVAAKKKPLVRRSQQKGVPSSLKGKTEKRKGKCWEGADKRKKNKKPVGVRPGGGNKVRQEDQTTTRAKREGKGKKRTIYEKKREA